MAVRGDAAHGDAAQLHFVGLGHHRVRVAVRLELEQHPLDVAGEDPASGRVACAEHGPGGERGAIDQPAAGEIRSRMGALPVVGSTSR